jgi:hypothetical protein
VMADLKEKPQGENPWGFLLVGIKKAFYGD